MSTHSLTNHEENLRAKLMQGVATLSEGMELYSALTSRGVPFQLEWEQKVLELCLLQDPKRLDILTRYRNVLLALGMSIPKDVESRFSDLTREEERGTDHQRAAAIYAEKTGLGDTEPEFRELAERVRKFTMTSYERMYALYKAVEYLERADLAGDVVECGVWRGGSMMLVAHTLLRRGRSDRELYLFDTYDGLPRPDEDKDVDIWGNRAIDGWMPRRTSEESSYWAEAHIEDVKANLSSTGYPVDRLHFVKGLVERTIPGAAPERIALLRLDTDWYASTKHELEHLFPRLVKNGVLIVDDYGHFAGARNAVDEYLASRNLPLMLTRIDYTGRILLKTF